MKQLANYLFESISTDDENKILGFLQDQYKKTGNEEFESAYIILRDYFEKKSRKFLSTTQVLNLLNLLVK